jgi:hypothetical protein
MFNVNNTVPGFRVGTADDELGLANFDPTGESYQMLSPSALLARNPCLCIAGNRRGIGTFPWGGSSNLR